ncbi:hypothetical protein LCI18_010507 [Fusarium solani-melongenae]|uniref:Uncharacterized protein n=1 Tax=Fusarium solani subsp. cucurbitae TaxID=2747967 RepID=A0ACD3ZEC0_FUSSC|nr:hypothetical protein LCI18_010507 [Fusarium solani-melongenae]
MTLELPQRESFATRSGNSYSYIHIQPTSRDTTLLLLHGFPSTLGDWVHQIRYFSSKGYGILAPDLLGYGSSSKPTDVHQYRLKTMGDELIELLDHLNLQKVVGIGHDFGATLLSRLAAYHPDRWASLIFLAVGPPKLGTPFDIDMINKMTKEFLGFEMLGLIFCRDRQAWDEWFHPLGKMKQFVTEDRRLPIGPWYTDGLQKEHLKAFGVEDGYKGASTWYRMWMDNLFEPDEKGFGDFQISQPALFVVPQEPEQSMVQQQRMLASWAPNLQTAKLDAGHWIHLERPDETNAAIQQFLEVE